MLMTAHVHHYYRGGIKAGTTSIQCPEESRSVTVCVEVCRPVIDTPIDFTFSVLLNTIDGTAGK